MLIPFFRRSRRRQDLKERIVKNRQGVMGAMSECVEGARQCPFLLGEKCIGKFCEFFVKYTKVDHRNLDLAGNPMLTDYHRCVFIQSVSMQIEGNNELRSLNRKIDELLNVLKVAR